MAEMKFIAPAMFEDSVTRTYNLDETVYGIQTMSTDFNVKYGENAPHINGLLFSLINACVVSDFDKKFGYNFKAIKTARNAIIRLAADDAPSIFNTQMETLINETIDDKMKSALMDADNFNHSIHGFDYLDLHNDAYAGVIFLVKSIIESAKEEFKKCNNLSNVYYRDNDILTNIRVHKNKDGKNYTVHIVAFTEKMCKRSYTQNDEMKG